MGRFPIQRPLAALAFASGLGACASAGPQRTCVSLFPSALDRLPPEIARDESARFARAHVSLPANEEEARALKGMAIVVVDAFATNASDLPLKSVAIESGAQTHHLPSIFPLNPVTKEPKHGLHHQRLYLFAPLKHLLEKGALAVKFAGRGASVPLIPLPIPSRVTPAPEPDPRALPDPVATVRILATNYCFGR